MTDMKKIIKYIIPLCVSAIFLVSCDDEDKVDHNTTLTPLTYITADTSIELKNTTAEKYTFEWNASKAADLSAVFYEVQFSDDSEFKEIVYSELPTKLGSSTFLVVNDSTLNIIAEKAGIKQSSTDNLYWRVKASNGINEYIPEARKIAITRPAGFAAYPVELYALGSAVEKEGSLKMIKNVVKGSNSTDTVPNISVFDMVATLKKGDLSFVNSLSGRSRSFSVEEGKLVEDAPAIAIPADGVYRIRFNFKTLAVEATAIQGIDQIIVKKDAEHVVFKSLEYKGNSVWEASYDALLPDGSNLPNGTQYKFRVNEMSLLSGNTEYTYWGSPSNTASPPTASTDAFYFYVTKVDNEAITANQLNYYRFPNSVSGKQMKTTLNLNAEGANYSHSCSLVE